MGSNNSNIFKAAANPNELPLLKRLIEEKANIEARNEQGRTPLILGSMEGHLEIVKYLVGMKANIEAKDIHGHTPLGWGSFNGKFETIKYLVGMKANIEAKDSYGNTPLFMGLMNGNFEIVKYLVGMKANIEAKDNNGRTPLGWGSYNGHLEIVKYLVGMKANIEAKDIHGNTPLFVGLMKGHLEIVKYLVGMKANIETKDNYGRTPLGWGSYNGHLEIVKYLVGMKANIETKNNYGLMPIDMAEIRGHESITEYLRDKKIASEKIASAKMNAETKKTKKTKINTSQAFSGEVFWTFARLCSNGTIAEIKDFANARFRDLSCDMIEKRDELVQTLKKEAIRAVTVPSLKDCCNKHKIKGYSGKKKGDLGQMIFDKAASSSPGKPKCASMESDSSDDEDEPIRKTSPKCSSKQNSKKEVVLTTKSMPPKSNRKRTNAPTVEDPPTSSLSKKIKSGLTKQDKESKGPENDEFEQFLKIARLSEYAKTLRDGGYEYVEDLSAMGSEEIEKYFKKTPHRKRFERAIKKMNKTTIKETKQATVVRPSKKPKPVITHKFALIIGNGNYSTSPLGSNPVNDAQAMKEKFGSEYGYKVFYHENLTSGGMKKAIEEFEDALCQHKGESLAVVFFAGHGVQTPNRNQDAFDNYLLGIDNDYKHERELKRRELSTKRIIEGLDEANVKILLLDCCRNASGLPRSMVSKHRSLTRGGLKIAKEELTGCMTLYACQPGDVAQNGDTQNGLFTESLLSAFKSQKKKKHSPRFFDLVREAEKVMKKREQMPAVEIPHTGNVIEICIDGTLYADWYENS